MKGFIKIHRQLFQSPVFEGQVFDRRSAWLWMLSEARFEAGIKYIEGREIHLERGQFAASLRFMANAWGWKKDAVRRLVGRFETATMIATDTATGIYVVTICNYERYQGEQTRTATASATPTATQTRQERDSNATNYNNGKKGKKGKKVFTGKVISLTQEDYDRWVQAYPRVDLSAELQSLDDYYSSEGVEPDKWFARCSAALAKKNRNSDVIDLDAEARMRRAIQEAQA